MEGQQLAFFSEERDYRLELRCFPAAFLAGKGALQPEEIEIGRKNLDKVHRQLRHGSGAQMRRWDLPCAGSGHRNVGREGRIIPDMGYQCAMYERRREVPGMSKRGDLVAHTPNDIVAMDAAELTAPNGPAEVWAIRAMDVVTKFPKACTWGQHANRRASGGALMDWRQIFSARPERIAADQNPEFINRFAEVCTMSRGTSHLGPPAHAPASNGLNVVAM